MYYIDNIDINEYYIIDIMLVYMLYINIEHIYNK